MGYLVPNPQEVGHHKLPISLIREYTSFDPGWPRFDDSCEEIWNRVDDEVSDSDCQNVIISAEVFCDLANESCIEQQPFLSDFIAKRFDSFDVKVVCYLRNLLQYLQSLHGECIKISPLTHNFSENLAGFFANESMHLYPTRYLQFFEKLFGPDSMIVRQYDLEVLTDGNVVRDFLSVIGLGEQATELLQRWGKDSSGWNPSIKPEHLNLKRAVNIAGNPGFMANQNLSRMLLESVALADKVEREIPAAISQSIAREQATLNERYGINFATDTNFTADAGSSQSAEYLYLLSMVSLGIRLAEESKVMLSELQAQQQESKVMLTDLQAMLQKMERERAAPGPLIRGLRWLKHRL